MILSRRKDKTNSDVSQVKTTTNVHTQMRSHNVFDLFHLSLHVAESVCLSSCLFQASLTSRMHLLSAPQRLHASLPEARLRRNPELFADLRPDQPALRPRRHHAPSPKHCDFRGVGPARVSSFTPISPYPKVSSPLSNLTPTSLYQ